MILKGLYTKKPLSSGFLFLFCSNTAFFKFEYLIYGVAEGLSLCSVYFLMSQPLSCIQKRCLYILISKKWIIFFKPFFRFTICNLFNNYFYRQPCSLDYRFPKHYLRANNYTLKKIFLRHFISSIETNLIFSFAWNPFYIITIVC